mmetsp:Transcript_33547/g.111972  ORF Transcript_33547/g.111972 Transcript_33547/m.111972 type:complete len:207 (-) Transcript_33547:575-1195(-)
MLNHIDTPHIDIASAVTASACVPGLIEPVVLLERGPDGALRPFHHLDASDDRITLRDGSFESDVPLKQLLGAFGCCFTIVSQVNPHIACFYAHPCGRPGRPSAGRDRTGAWRGGFLLSAIEVAIKEDLRRHLRTIQRLRLMSDLTGFDLTQMWLQEQDGSVTLTPAIQLGDLTALISNLKEPAQLSRRIPARRSARPPVKWTGNRS